MMSSQRCIDLIKQFEGFSAKPYTCPAGVATIGIGSTHYTDGRAVTLSDPSISELEACHLLLATLKHYEDAVTQLVKVALNQNQFDALVDFNYNCGISSFKTSSLLRLLNTGDYVGASNQFLLWVHANGKVLVGLYKRRLAEKNLFISGVT